MAGERNETQSSYVSDGEAFERDTNYITTRVTVDGADGFPVEPGRYRLVVARACPWANRAMIARRLYGLEDVISLGMCGPTHDARSWTFDLDPDGRDPVLGIHYLRDAYDTRQPGYPRGVTVPALVDTTTGAVATNDFAQMTLDFGSQWREYHRPGARDLTPQALRPEMDEWMEFVLRDVNNGVYRCGFAGSQHSYDEAYDDLWAALDVLEERLSTRRYLMGPSITEADVRLFPTLIRFDAVYHGHFKCNRQTLASLPHLSGYTRDLFATPGFGDTIDFMQVKQHYYIVHADLNPTRIVPRGPRLDGLLTPHDRDRLPTDTWGAGGTPPPPPLSAEVVDPAHTPLRVSGC